MNFLIKLSKDKENLESKTELTHIQMLIEEVIAVFLLKHVDLKGNDMIYADNLFSRLKGKSLIHLHVICYIYYIYSTKKYLAS